MTEEAAKPKKTHAERLGPGGFKKSSLTLPSDAKGDWPLNLKELLEWYTREVEDISRAAQLRIREATKIVTDCTRGEIDLEEAANRISNPYSRRWGDALYGISDSQGMTDEEIYQHLDARFASKGPSEFMKAEDQRREARGIDKPR
jgi:hypothetical protein